MASGSIIPSAGGNPITDAIRIENLPKEISGMKIKNDKGEKVILENRMHTLCLIYFSLSTLCKSHCDILIGNGSSCCGWKWN